MACDLKTLLSEACANNFLQLAATDPKTARAVMLQLLCDISGGSIGGVPFSNKVSNPITSFSAPYTNNSGKPMLLVADVTVVAAQGSGASVVNLTSGDFGTVFQQADISVGGAGNNVLVHCHLTTILQPGESAALVNASDPVTGNAINQTASWY